MNIGPLPALLAERDEIEIAITADGVSSNEVTASILSAQEPGAWGRRADLPEANSEMSIGDANGKIYVIGGYPSSRVSVATVQEFDPVAGRWRLSRPLPVALNHTMSASVGGNIYVIGGQTGAGGAGPFVDTVYKFDTAGETWTTRAPRPMNFMAIGPTPSQVKSRIFNPSNMRFLATLFLLIRHTPNSSNDPGFFEYENFLLGQT